MALSRRDIQNIRAGKSILPRRISRPVRTRITRTQEAWVREQLRTGAQYPQGSPEAKQLARYASYASWGKADPRYEAAFGQYWYHNRSGSYADEADEEYDYEEDEEEELLR